MRLVAIFFGHCISFQLIGLDPSRSSSFVTDALEAKVSSTSVNSTTQNFVPSAQPTTNVSRKRVTRRKATTKPIEGSTTVLDLAENTTSAQPTTNVSRKRVTRRKTTTKPIEESITVLELAENTTQPQEISTVSHHLTNATIEKGLESSVGEMSSPQVVRYEREDIPTKRRRWFNNDKEELTEKEIGDILSNNYDDDDDFTRTSYDKYEDSDNEETTGDVERKFPKRQKLPKLSLVKRKRLQRKEKRRLAKLERNLTVESSISKRERFSEEKNRQREDDGSDDSSSEMIMRSQHATKEESSSNFIEGVGWVDDQSKLEELLEAASAEDNDNRENLKHSHKNYEEDYDERGKRTRQKDRDSRGKNTRFDERFDQKNAKIDRYRNNDGNDRYRSSGGSKFGNKGDRKSKSTYRESKFRSNDNGGSGGSYRNDDRKSGGGYGRESNFRRNDDRRSGGGYGRESNFRRKDDARSSSGGNRKSGFCGDGDRKSGGGYRESNFRRDNDKKSDGVFKESNFRREGRERGREGRERDTTTSRKPRMNDENFRDLSGVD